MYFKESKRVRVNARPELGLGEVLRVQESAGHYLADVVFQVGEHRILETYPATALESVPTTFERYLRGESDSITDFCRKQQRRPAQRYELFIHHATRLISSRPANSPSKVRSPDGLK